MKTNSLLITGLFAFVVSSHSLAKDCSAFVERVPHPIESLQGKLNMLNVLGLDKSVVDQASSWFFFKAGGEPVFLDHLQNGIQLLIVLGSARMPGWSSLAEAYLRFMQLQASVPNLDSTHLEGFNKFARKSFLDMGRDPQSVAERRVKGVLGIFNSLALKAFLEGRPAKNSVVDPWISEIIQNIQRPDYSVPQTRVEDMLSILIAVRSIDVDLGLEPVAASAKGQLDFELEWGIPDFSQMIGSRLQGLRGE